MLVRQATEPSRRIRALQAGITAALIFGDDRLAARLTVRRDAAAAEPAEAAHEPTAEPRPTG